MQAHNYAVNASGFNASVNYSHISLTLGLLDYNYTILSITIYDDNNNNKAIQKPGTGLPYVQCLVQSYYNIIMYYACPFAYYTCLCEREYVSVWVRACAWINVGIYEGGGMQLGSVDMLGSAHCFWICQWVWPGLYTTTLYYTVNYDCYWYHYY